MSFVSSSETKSDNRKDKVLYGEYSDEDEAGEAGEGLATKDEEEDDTDDEMDARPSFGGQGLGFASKLNADSDLPTNFGQQPARRVADPFNKSGKSDFGKKNAVQAGPNGDDAPKLRKVC